LLSICRKGKKDDGEDEGTTLKKERRKSDVEGTKKKSRQSTPVFIGGKLEEMGRRVTKSKRRQTRGPGGRVSLTLLSRSKREVIWKVYDPLRKMMGADSRKRDPVEGGWNFFNIAGPSKSTLLLEWGKKKKRKRAREVEGGKCLDYTTFIRSVKRTSQRNV